MVVVRRDPCLARLLIGFLDRPPRPSPSSVNLRQKAFDLIARGPDFPAAGPAVAAFPQAVLPW